MKIFRADAKWKYQIDELDFVRETEHFVVVSLKDGRELIESKMSSDHRYSTKFNDAKQWLIEGIDLKIKNMQSDLDKLKSQKQKVNNL